MFELLLGHNPFALQLDPERHAAHRREIKRAIAEISVKKLSIVELKNIVQKLNDDSDKAAGEHGVEAARLQGELDELDRQQIEHVLASTTTPPKEMMRRRLILDELTELNRTLEVRCEANRRASGPIEQQINTLSRDITSEGALRNQLVSLASAAIRRKMKVCELKLQLANAGVKEAQRLAGTIEYNGQISKVNHDHSAAAVASVRLDDAKAVVEMMQREIGEIHAESARLQAEAMAE